ncbi:MAG: hypothetical protein ACK5CY_10255 [Bacteroidia bacterium]|jgi:hypothetical protein
MKRNNRLHVLISLLVLFSNLNFSAQVYYGTEGFPDDIEQTENSSIIDEKKIIIDSKIGNLEYEEDYYSVVTDEVFEALTLYEKFLYCVVYPEDFSQNCNPDAQVHQKQINKRLYGWISDANEYQLSYRQIEFLKQNRAVIIEYIKNDVEYFKSLPEAYKNILIEIDATELIPWLIHVFENYTMRSDGQLLTVFFQLMRNNEYVPFTTSTSFNKLYGFADHRINYIEFNNANINLTVERAMGLYVMKHK